MDEKQIKIVTDYFSDKHDVVAVYLFGSQASGKQRPFSDVDIAILFKHGDRGEMHRKRDDHMAALSRKLRKNIHPVVLNTAGETLAKQVFTKGKCILDKDHRALAVFKMVMYARIADFAYYRKLMQEGFIRKTIGDA
jgi:predicted nucleotidyltransferase